MEEEKKLQEEKKQLEEEKRLKLEKKKKDCLINSSFFLRVIFCFSISTHPKLFLYVC